MRELFLTATIKDDDFDTASAILQGLSADRLLSQLEFHARSDQHKNQPLVHKLPMFALILREDEEASVVIGNQS